MKIASIVFLFLLASCSVGKGYIFDTDSKCRVVWFGKEGSGTITSPYGSITLLGPGSYHVIGEGCEGVSMHPAPTRIPEEAPVP